MSTIKLKADVLLANEELYDKHDIRQTLEWSFQPGDTFEIRALGSQNKSWIKTASGYFQDAGKATAQVTAHVYEYRPDQVYCTLNAAQPEIYGRAKDRIELNPGKTTKDSEIQRLRSVLIDCDPIRHAGVPSSDTELKAAEELTNQIKTWLEGQGFPPPLVAMSGNGYHLRYAVDLDAQDSVLVKAFLQALAKRFNTAEVHVDTTVFNPSRICKLYGTMTRKGDDVPEQQRFNRMSRLIECPERQEATKEQIQAIIELSLNEGVTTNEHFFQAEPAASTITSNAGDPLGDCLAGLLADAQLPSHNALPLLDHHREHLRTSGLSGVTIDEAEFRSVNAHEAQQFGFPPWPGLLIPYPQCEGYYRLRPDSPRPDEHGRTAKYLSRKGSTNRLYVPSSAKAMLRDSSRPLIITEGEKKALKGCQEGFCTVGLSGVWNWKSTDKELIDDLEAIRWKKRRVYVAFDSDIVEKSEAQAALRAFVEVLEKRGAEVRVVLLPSGDDGKKVGLDDYLLNHTADDLQKLIHDAVCLLDAVLSFIRPGLKPHELETCLEDVYRTMRMYPASIREYARKVHSLLNQCGYDAMPVGQIEAAIRKVRPFVAVRRGTEGATPGEKKDPRDLTSHEVAVAMVANCYTDGQAQTLRYYKGQFIEWRSTHYVVQRDD
ncbi:MAG: DUF3854 domain-containing protein, partial [Desulfovibrionales bacterium]|nr:DUF3854 domain-containing protein [Desulfovibrionales bacterium]